MAKHNRKQRKCLLNITGNMETVREQEKTYVTRKPDEKKVDLELALRELKISKTHYSARVQMAWIRYAVFLSSMLIF